MALSTTTTVRGQGLRAWRIALGLVIFYAMIAGVVGYFAVLLLKNTKTSFEAPKDTIAHQAEVYARQQFPNQITNNLMILVQTTDGKSTVITEEYKTFVHDVRTAVERDELVASVMSYYSHNESQWQKRFLRGNSALMLVNLKIGLNTGLEKADRFMKVLHKVIGKTELAHNPKYAIQKTGLPYMIDSLTEDAAADMGKIDAVSMPFAILALAYCVKSFRALVLPMFTLPLAGLIGFALLYPISLVRPMGSFVPEFLMATCTGLTIDYSLFLLTRMQEQIACHELRVASGEIGEEEASNTTDVRFKIIRNTTLLSAHNVVVSGLTISAAFIFTGVLLPVKLISTSCIGCGIGSFTTVLVNMTFSPAFMLVAYGFFSNECKIWGPCLRWMKVSGDEPKDKDEGGKKVVSPSSVTDSIQSGTQKPLIAPAEGEQGQISEDEEDVKDPRQEEQRNSVWFRISQRTVRHPYIVIGAVFICAIPVFYACSLLKVDFGILSQMPLSSDAVKVFMKIDDIFGIASALPYQVLVVSNIENNVFHNDFFAEVNTFVDKLKKEFNFQSELVTSMTQPDGIPLTGEEAYRALHNRSSPLHGPLQMMYEQLVNGPKNSSLIVNIKTPFDPMGSEANDFLNKLDAICAEARGQSKMKLFYGFVGAATDSWAAMKAVMASFPMQIGTTLGVIFVMIALFFKSISVPIRMVVTIAFTVAFSFGIGVLFFQYTWTHSIWPNMKTANVTAYAWIVPIFTLGLLCAFALDYDVFLLTRVAELRRRGYSDHAAIQKAVYRTGKIISFAGLIMMISFGSLMGSSIVLLNQQGLVCVVAIGVDTLVVRTLLVPALMSVAPTVAWWPRKFERSDRDVWDMDEDHAGSVEEYRTPSLSMKTQ